MRKQCGKITLSNFCNFITNVKCRARNTFHLQKLNKTALKYNLSTNTASFLAKSSSWIDNGSLLISFNLFYSFLYPIVKK
jgi:hypothetical protein